MARSQERPRRKASGGRYHPSRTKKRQELSGYPAQTKLEAAEKQKKTSKKKKEIFCSFFIRYSQNSKVTIQKPKSKKVKIKIVAPLLATK